MEFANVKEKKNVQVKVFNIVGPMCVNVCHDEYEYWLGILFPSNLIYEDHQQHHHLITM